MRKLPESERIMSAGFSKFDFEKVRKDFPILQKKLDSGKPLVYFDNSATAQKPQCVINSLSKFYSEYNSNIHRSTHELADKATREFESSRKCVQKFFKASESEYSAIFTRGATESLNIVAQCWGGANLKDGDEIVMSQMEHHANIVPWQIAAKKTGARIRVAQIENDGSLDLRKLETLICQRTKIVSITHASNVLGTVNDIEKISRLARKVGALVCIDAAQSAPHAIDDMSDGLVDFLSVSAHKCYGPTGVGALIGRKKILDLCPPYQGGGDMIENVSWENTTFKDSPARFEAGTPDIAGAIAFKAALEYLDDIGISEARSHEKNLGKYFSEKLSNLPRVKVYGNAEGKLPIFSFNCENIHPNDISTMLGASGIAVRTGHHCAEPLASSLGIKASCRASLSFYNTFDEIDFFFKMLERAIKVLS